MTGSRTSLRLKPAMFVCVYAARITAWTRPFGWGRSKNWAFTSPGAGAVSIEKTSPISFSTALRALKILGAREKRAFSMTNAFRPP